MEYSAEVEIAFLCSATTLRSSFRVSASTSLFQSRLANEHRNALNVNIIHPGYVKVTRFDIPGCGKQGLTLSSYSLQYHCMAI